MFILFDIERRTKRVPSFTSMILHLDCLQVHSYRQNFRTVCLILMEFCRDVRYLNKGNFPLFFQFWAPEVQSNPLEGGSPREDLFLSHAALHFTGTNSSKILHRGNKFSYVSFTTLLCGPTSPSGLKDISKSSPL